MLDDFFARHKLADVRISINDVGATPAVVSLRLDQAVESFLGGAAMTSYYEASARERLHSLLDPGSFHEFLPPTERVVSPHLVAAGHARRLRRRRHRRTRRRSTAKPFWWRRRRADSWAAPWAKCMAPSSSACCERARDEKPAAVLLLVESGGVRLHEANAGLIGVSEIMRAVLALRSAGVPVIVLDGGQFGCFGGMGIAARLCDAIVMSEEGRLGLSGPEVIETTCGVEEFDSRDRALVWRTVGGKHRYLLGEADALVADDIEAFRKAAIGLLTTKPDLSLEALTSEHDRLGDRLERFGACRDALDIWSALGIEAPEGLPLLEADAFARRGCGKEGLTWTPKRLLDKLFPDGCDVAFDGPLFQRNGRERARKSRGHRLDRRGADRRRTRLPHGRRRPAHRARSSRTGRSCCWSTRRASG